MFFRSNNREIIERFPCLFLNTLKSFILFGSVKTIRKLNLEHVAINLKKKFEKLAVVVHVLQTT